MEMAYSIPKSFPSPSFKGGTPGYMSPEQNRNETPTTKEDIYGIGGLLTYFFCGFSPLRLNIFNPEHHRNALFFLTGDQPVSQLIVNCFSIDPATRPSIQDIALAIQQLTNAINTDKVHPPVKIHRLEREIVDALIESYLLGLGDPQMADSQCLWTTIPTGLPGFIAKLNRGYLPGLSNGAAGVLYWVARVHKPGYPFANIQNTYQTNWAILDQGFLNQDQT